MMRACFRHNTLYMIKNISVGPSRGLRGWIPPAKPVDLISIPRAHVVVRTPSHKLSSDVHKHAIGTPSLSLEPIPITLEKKNFKENKLLNEDVNNSPGAKPFVCTGEHIWCVGYVHVFITQPLGKGLIET